MAVEDLLGRLAGGEGRCGVVAEFVGECGKRGADGVTWRLRATDGERLELVKLQMTGSDGGVQGMGVEPQAIEYLAEGLAGHFPAEVRLSAMAARSEHVALPVRPGDLDRAARQMGHSDPFSA